MAITLDLHERLVQDELIQLLRDELGYRYMGRLDIEVQKFDAAGRIQKSMVGKNREFCAPRFLALPTHKNIQFTLVPHMPCGFIIS